MPAFLMGPTPDGDAAGVDLDPAFSLLVEVGTALEVTTMVTFLEKKLSIVWSGRRANTKRHRSTHVDLQTRKRRQETHSSQFLNSIDKPQLGSRV